MILWTVNGVLEYTSDFQTLRVFMVFMEYVVGLFVFFFFFSSGNLHLRLALIRKLLLGRSNR